MMDRLVLRAAAVFLLPGAASAQHFPPWTPALAATLIGNVGLPAASQDFARQGGLGWKQILDGIQTGDPAWLALVPRLAPTPDAAAAKAIPIALSLALPQRPANVLKLLPDTYPIGQICAGPAIGASRARLRAFYRAAIPALRALHTPELAAIRDACVASLRAAARRHRIPAS